MEQFDCTTEILFIQVFAAVTSASGNADTCVSEWLSLIGQHAVRRPWSVFLAVFFSELIIFKCPDRL